MPASSARCGPPPGVKNPDYDDTMYVVDLVVEDTVNTMPEKTLDAVADHGEVRGDRIRPFYDDAAAHMQALADAGIDYDDVIERAHQGGCRQVRRRLGRAPDHPGRVARGRPGMTGPGSGPVDPTTTPAWAHLTRIADGYSLDLRRQLADDPAWVPHQTLTAGDLRVDLSKNLWDDGVDNVLRQLADEVDLAGRRDAMFAGEHINVTEDRAVLHTALRLPRRRLAERRRAGRRRRRPRGARQGLRLRRPGPLR